MTEYTQASLQRLLADTITHHLPLSSVKTVLDAGAKADGAVMRGLRPLHYAVMENDIEAMTELIERGADVNAEDDVGYTPLYVACKHGRLDSVKTLLEHQAIINFSDEHNALSDSSPLNLAIENNHQECLQLLLQNGGDPNQKYFLGHEINLTPLENIACLSLLLQHGANPDSIGRNGLTVLMKACKQQDEAAIRLLLLHGADVNVECPPRFDQKTALHFATLSGNVTIMLLLIKAGARLCASDNYKYAPLELAIIQGKYEGCKVLLEHGADVNEINTDGCSPLQIACSSLSLKHSKEIIEQLLMYGAEPNYSCKLFSYISPSLSPIVEYLSYNTEYDGDVIDLLLSFGACVNIRKSTKALKIVDPAGVLAHWCKLRPYEDIMQRFLDFVGHFDVNAIRAEKSLCEQERKILLSEASVPRTLKHLSRLLIRRIMRLPLPTSVIQLTLPPLLQQFVLGPMPFILDVSSL